MHSTIRIPVGATYGADEALPDMPQALTVADAIYHTVHGYPGGVVALAAGAPEREWEAYCIGRGPRGGVHAMGYQPPEQPLSALCDLVGIYDAGRREPLPLPLKTSLEWARARQFDDPVPERGAESEWRFEKDGAEHVEVWGPGAPLHVLLDPPRPDEVAIRGETTRLGAYASRLWQPLLDAERRI